MQGVRGSEHLSAPARQERVQGVRGPGPLPAPARQEPVHGVRRREHLRPPAHSERLPGVRGPSICEHKRRRSRCQECGGGGLCEHQRERSKCKACREDADEAGRSSGKAPWAVVMRPAREDSQSSVASHSRQEVLGTIPSVHEDYLTKKKGVCLAPAKHATTHT